MHHTGEPRIALAAPRPQARAIVDADFEPVPLDRPAPARPTAAHPARAPGAETAAAPAPARGPRAVLQLVADGIIV
ncbi:hypothetical protein DLJ53_03940 [Acuticoccus sediminis]|uniref:Uncharacterized protein n=2 Tax=Acuticoccus sediminis TaxID=2184697 RepID=A0A8B2P0G9_9HYPH|nr:hypothetical protein DLJ53_03940 [Acuticoccus sediminis]